MKKSEARSQNTESHHHTLTETKCYENISDMLLSFGGRGKIFLHFHMPFCFLNFDISYAEGKRTKQKDVFIKKTSNKSITGTYGRAN